MKRFNLVKSLTRVINNIPALRGKARMGLRLLILCLSLAVLGVNEVWALRYAGAYVYSSPTTGGYVYVTETESNVPSGWTGTDDSSEDYNLKTSDYTFNFWAYARVSSDNYIFKGWATSDNTNTIVSTTALKYTIPVSTTSSNNTEGKRKKEYRYAIFARMTVDNSSPIDFGAKNVDADNKATVKLTAVHAGDGNISLIDNNSGYFSIDGGGQYSSVQNEETKTITVHYLPKAAGTHSAKLQITGSNGMTTITIPLSGSAKSKAEMSWNPNTNVMNVGDVLTEENLTYSDGSRQIKFITDNAAVVKINESGYPEAVGEGTANVTAKQDADASWYESSATQEITVTNKQKQTITWDDDLSFKFTGSAITQPLTATATSGMTVTYSPTSGSFFTIENGQLKITGIGEAQLTATQAGNDDWIETSITRRLVSRDPNATCDDYIYEHSSQETIGYRGSWETGSLGGEPRTVTFSAHQSGASAFSPKLKLEQYYSGSWHEVITISNLSDSDKPYGPYELNRGTTNLKFTNSDGTLSRYVSKINVTRAKYLESQTDKIDFGNIGFGNSVSRTFSIDYSNIQGPLITSCSNTCYTISPNEIGSDCGDYKKNVIVTVTFHATATGQQNGRIYLTDEKVDRGGLELYVDVSANVTKTVQDILWNDPTTFNTTDKPTLSATATSGLPISSYSSDNESIAKVVNGNQLEFYGSGKVNITAHQDGNDFYEPASLTKEFTISKVTPTIVTLPTAGNAITYGSRLGDVALTGGSAKDDKDNIVAGHFVWTSPDEIPHGGQQSYTVRFIPDNTDMYTSDAVSTQKLAIMVAKANQTLTWDVEQITIRKEDGDYTLTASSTSGRAITYTLSDPSLGTINGNVLTPLISGDCKITAICPEDGDYNASNAIEKQLFIAGPDEIVWKYKEGDHVWAGQNLNANGNLATAHTEVWFGGDLNHLTVNNTTNPKMVYTEIASDDALVTISASTLGDDYYASVNSSIQVYIDRCYQGLNWDQSFVSYTASAEGQIDLTIPLTAVAVDSLNNSTNLPIVYSVDNTSVAEITGNAIDGWNLHIKGTGEATLTASVSPTNIYQGVSDTRKINVRREGEHCGSYVLISTGEKNINQINNDTYTFSRPGETLTFKTRKYVAITLNANVTVEGYNIKENAWQNIDKYKLDFTSKQTKTYTISEDFRKIRMYTDADIENNYRYISDLYITQKEYLRPSVQEINAEIYINQDFSQTFTVDYSDKPYINCTIDNDQLEILRDDDNNTCGEYGTISFTVRSKNKWLTPTSISGTITLNTTVGDNITIPVSVDVKLGGTYKFTNATGDGDWTNLNNWDYGGSVPTSLPQMMNQVEIRHPVRVTTNVEVYELEVKPEDKTQGWNGHITISPTGGITIYNGGVTGIDNKLTIESSKEHTGYFRVVPSVVKGWYASPTATIEFATRSTLDTGADKDATWQYFGPAVEGVNFTADYNTWLYDWSEQKGWVNMRDGKSHSLQPFHGYVITQYGQPVYDFTGSLLMGDYDITLTKTPSGMNGSNIIVNSYPSPIDVTKFTEEDFDEGINKTFYLYNSGSWNQWQAGQDAETLANKQDNTPGTYYAIPVLSAKYLTDCQTIIPPMNGIYVTTTIDGAQMHLSYEKHVWPAFATDMNLPLRAPMRRAVAEDENIEDNFDKPLDRISVDTTNYAKQLAHRVVLRVTSENSGSDRVTLLEHTNHEHFTSGYDNGYDARKMGTQGVVNVFTNEQSGMYAVSATNDIDNMYIGIVSGSDNAYQLSVSSVVGEDLYLKDLVADVEIPLIEGQTYWFNMTPNTENDNRFIILHRQTEPFIPTSSNEINSDAYIWISGNSLHIENASADSYMQLYAADGKLLYTEKINRSAELQINHLPNSVYLVNVDGKQMKFVKK